MAKKEFKILGTKEEQDTFTMVFDHYSFSMEDLDTRRTDFDKKDELFRSHIKEEGWPYNSVVFDPRVFTTIFEKTSRLFAKKPRGRLVPREGGDTIGAKVSNELLKFQWDDNERVGPMPMLAKWALMDQNARKYGAAFAVCKWHYETYVDKKDKKRKPWYDGPDFKVWNNRDVLVDPSYPTIKNWIQLRDYVTIDDLKNINDAAKTKPVYKNLDLLEQSLKEGGVGRGDTRANNYQIPNKTIKDLQDTLGRDRSFRTVEVVTEYRRDRWITFAPKHGVVIRDIPNPYDHQQIPVVMLKYYPIDEDIYGLSEIEPVERLQRGINSLINQYLDSINMALYPILKVRSTGVQMHTLEFGPGKKWLMDDPENVTPHEFSLAGISEFTSTYRFMVSALQEALGETSAGISTAVPGAGEKTATEVKDSALQRNARDNFNQIFLSEAIKKQMMFWHKMNQQFLFANEEDKVKVIRIVGREAIRYFEQVGMANKEISDEAVELLTSPELADLNIRPEELATEKYPVEMKDGKLPKFTVDIGGELGYLLLEEDDLAGNYDYIPDIESMSLPDDAQMVFARQQMLQTVSELQPLLMAEGATIKIRQLLEDMFEQMGLKDASKYFGKAENGVNQAGAGSIGGSPQGQGIGQPAGMEGSTPPGAGDQIAQLMGGSPKVGGQGQVSL